MRIRHSEGEITDQLNKRNENEKSEGSQAVEERGKKELEKVTTEDKKLSSPSPALTQLKLSGTTHDVKDIPRQGPPNLLTQATSLLLEGFSSSF